MNKKLVITIAAILTILVAIGFGAFYWLNGSQKDTTKTTQETPKSLPSGKIITNADIIFLDKSDLFWNYFKNAAMQQKLVITKEYSTSKTPTGTADSIIYSKSGFDYSTKKSVYAYDYTSPATGELRDKSRCINGEYYSMAMSSTSWKRNASEDSVVCKLDYYASNINDGINTGGLTQAQADTFTDTLRNRTNNYVEVKSVDIISHNNKQYLHFRVEMRPSFAQGYGYIGGQWLMVSFKETGLDPTTYPYTYMGAAGDGYDYEYYVDPSTQLPAYSTILTSPQRDDSGKDVPVDLYNRYKCVYQFGISEFDASTNNNDNIAITW